MFARVQTVHQPAKKLDELAEVARNQLPAAHGLQGFKGFYYLTDREHEKALMISLWETEADLRQLEVHAVRQQAEAEAGIKSPPSEIFEVALRATT
jgi:heme-degrading monooxygenase HmoA